MARKRAKVDGEPELFNTRRYKGKIIERMSEGYFNKLLRTGWDPGFFIEVQKSDYPTLATRMIGGFAQEKQGTIDPADINDPFKQEIDFGPYLERRRCVVLSKGPDDPNRRIVAQHKDGWIVGLWISLLRRQLKHGMIDVQSWCFSALLDLERDGSFFHVQYENWLAELLTKEQP
jgi:hypothetical protein